MPKSIWFPITRSKTYRGPGPRAPGRKSFCRSYARKELRPRCAAKRVTILRPLAVNCVCKPIAKTGARSLLNPKSVEGLLHAGDRHPAFADSSGATLHRSGAHIARGKDAGQTGLQ